MHERDAGRALAGQIRSFVSGEIARRTSESEPPEVNLTSYATVDTTAIGEALKGLAPLIERSMASADEIRAGIADAVSAWARDDGALVAAIESREVDFSGLVAAIAAVKVPDHGRLLLQLANEIAELRAASDRQTAAIQDQTARMEAAAKLTRTVSYDAAGRVSQIKAGK